VKPGGVFVRQKLTLVTLGVKDLDASLNFYRDGLGWKPSSVSQNNIVFFDLGGVGLSLYPRNLLAEDATVSSEGTGFSGITLAHNAKSMEEVDATLQKAEQAGAKVIKKAQKVFWGGYSGYFSDPDGYLWEVAWNPFIGFDEKDALVFP
jgi:catechol 2,3-dioxygenase-like lactoylglutathione lyase family enzyme